jgi:molybdate transport system permease protein
VSLLTADDLTAVLLSLKVAALATAGGLPLALAVAYLLAKARFPGRAILDAATHLPLVLPPVATGFALLLLFGQRGPLGQLLRPMGLVLAFRWTGAALAAGVMAFPLMVRPIRLAIEAIDPEVDEAALTLGAGLFTRLRRVTIPLAGPGLAAGAVLGFVRALGEFGATITFVAAIPGETLTLPTAIYQSTQTPGEEPHTLILCALSTVIALAAILVSDAFSLRRGHERL